MGIGMVGRVWISASSTHRLACMLILCVCMWVCDRDAIDSSNNDNDKEETPVQD